MEELNSEFVMNALIKKDVDELGRENAKWIEEERWKDPTFAYWEFPEGTVFFQQHKYAYPIIIFLGTFLLIFTIHYLIYHFKKKEHPIRKAIINSLIVMWILIIVRIMIWFFYLLILIKY